MWCGDRALAPVSCEAGSRGSPSDPAASPHGGWLMPSCSRVMVMNFAAGSRSRCAIPLHPPEQVRCRDIEMSRLLPVRHKTDLDWRGRRRNPSLLDPLPSLNDLGAQPLIDQRRTAIPLTSANREAKIGRTEVADHPFDRSQTSCVRNGIFTDETYVRA